METEGVAGEEWSDAEIATFVRRNDRFLKIGVSEMDAERLAQEMLYRDRPVSGDDRRLCLECRLFAKGACRVRGRLALLTVLQRCDGFQMKGA